jgi:hypothetical protein
LSVISAISVSPKRHQLGLYFAIQDSNICADDFEAFVAELLIHFPKGIILVIDRWMVHRSGIRRLWPKSRCRMAAGVCPGTEPCRTDLESQQVWAVGQLYSG